MGSWWKMKAGGGRIDSLWNRYSWSRPHNYTKTDTHICAASVCRDCIIRPVGTGEVCLSRGGRFLLWPQYNMIQPILVFLCPRVQLKGFAAYMQWGMEFWKRLGHIIHTQIKYTQSGLNATMSILQHSTAVSGGNVNCKKIYTLGWILARGKAATMEEN